MCIYRWVTHTFVSDLRKLTGSPIWSWVDFFFCLNAASDVWCLPRNSLPISWFTCEQTEPQKGQVTNLMLHIRKVLELREQGHRGYLSLGDLVFPPQDALVHDGPVMLQVHTGVWVFTLDSQELFKSEEVPREGAPKGFYLDFHLWFAKRHEIILQPWQKP